MRDLCLPDENGNRFWVKALVERGHMVHIHGSHHDVVRGEGFLTPILLLHRDDGPAVERLDGSREWWFLGRRHREDGPASEPSARRDGAWWQPGRYWYVHGQSNDTEQRAERIL